MTPFWIDRPVLRVVTTALVVGVFGALGFRTLRAHTIDALAEAAVVEATAIAEGIAGSIERDRISAEQAFADRVAASRTRGRDGSGAGSVLLMLATTDEAGIGATIVRDGADVEANTPRVGVRLTTEDVVAARRGAPRGAVEMRTGLAVGTAPIDRTRFVRVERPVGTAIDRVNRTAGLTLVGFAGVMSLAIGWAIVAERRLRRRTMLLSEGARRFAEGELGFRIPRADSVELDRLVTALNQMARQLDERIRQVRQQRNEHESILQSIRSGMIALDRAQHVLRANHAAERIFGIRHEQSRGRLLQEVVREPRLHELVGAVLAESDEGDRSSAGEVERDPVAEFDLARDPERTVRASARGLRNAEDELVGAVLIVDDITDLRRLESMRADFAANVSHELRTPITNIKGYVETMEEVGVDDPRQTARFLGIIRRNAERLGAIIEDLLALSSLERDFASERPESAPIRVAAIIGDVVDALGPTAEAKSIRLAREVDGDPAIEAFGQLPAQALSNLVTNAVRYSPEATTVRIHARVVDGENPGARVVRIDVVDQGPGVPARHQARLFERFYRVDTARSREQGGTGLGLAIVKHIALVHGGRASLTSSEPGVGSIFTLEFPLAADASDDP